MFPPVTEEIGDIVVAPTVKADSLDGKGTSTMGRLASDGPSQFPPGTL